MKNFFTALLVFMVWSFFGLWLYSWLEPEPNTSVAKTELTNSNSVDVPSIENNEVRDDIFSEEELTTPPIENNSVKETVLDHEEASEKGLRAITKTGETVFQYSEGLNIKKNTTKIDVPASVSNFKEAVKAYLDEHPDKELHIISLYAVTENNESPNLGTQRGKDVKRLLIHEGVPAEKIVVKSVIRDLSFTEDLIYNNSISLAFRPLDQARIDAILPELPDAMVVYPKFTGTKIYENNNLRNLVIQTKEALKINPDLSIDIIGHTDNIGSSAENYQLGLKFARQVRWYLISKSKIGKDKIKASSKGESESIDTNKSKRGRLANQRIEVVFY